MSEAERQRLLTELEDCRGREIYRTHEALRRTYRTLKVNYIELSNIVEELAGTGDQPPTSSDEYYTMLSDMCTHFHNFVCATKSTYEHTSTVKSKYFSEELEAEYYNKWNQIDPDDRRGHFVRELRNTTVHYLMPPLTTNRSRSLLDRLEGTRDPPTVYLDTQDLLDTGEFNKDSTEFLQEQYPESVDVMEVAQTYYSDIAEVNSWMTQAFRDAYSDELEERNQIIAELRALVDTTNTTNSSERA